MKSFKEHLTNTEDYLEVSDLPPVMESEKKQNHSQPHDPPPVLVMKRNQFACFQMVDELHYIMWIKLINM